MKLDASPAGLGAPRCGPSCADSDSRPFHSPLAWPMLQLLLRVVSSRAVEVRRSVAVHTRLIKLLAGVAAHDHPGWVGLGRRVGACRGGLQRVHRAPAPAPVPILQGLLLQFFARGPAGPAHWPSALG